MSKQAVIDTVAADLGISKVKATEAVNTVISAIGEVVKKSPVQFIGFGKFETVFRDARTGRNPLTGEPVAIASKHVLKFKPSK